MTQDDFSPAVSNVDALRQPETGAKDWLLDPKALTSWQCQLVESCDEISQQLVEIQYELTAPEGPSLPVFRLFTD